MGHGSRFLLGAFALFLAGSARAQTGAEDWNTRLGGKPLYLRGLWAADKLNFDGAGRSIEPAAQGSLTLSGVAVDSAMADKKHLVIHAHRVALVARADGEPGLERRDITSTTHIAFSLRHGDKSNFHAREEMQITVQPDDAGSFEPALSKIFADGLADLATGVPLFWKCYAASYFLAETVSADAERTVERCVVTMKDGEDPDAGAERSGAATPPVLISQGQPQLPAVAADLGVTGIAAVHVRIGADGVPVGLQIVRAVGGGIDEAVLQSIAQDRFKPATRGGTAVPVNLTMQIEIRPPA